MVLECPWPIIIGQPFMTEHKIAALITQNKGLKLYDFTSTEKVKILTIHKPIPQDLQPVKMPDSVFIPTKILTAQEFEEQKADYDKWRSMLNDDMKDLVDLLSSIKFMTFEVTDKQLRKAGYDVESQDDSNPVTTAAAEPVNVPCNFPEVQNELNKLITKYHNVFSSGSGDIGKSHGKKAKIRVTKSEPVNTPNYRTLLKLRQHLKNLIDELLNAGVIEKCVSSDYNSPCLLVPKKTDIGAEKSEDLNTVWCLVSDYRKLNPVVQNVSFPMPCIQDILSEYTGCKVFSVADIRHAFYTIELDTESHKFTAFSCKFGKWQFKFLPQGLKISPAVFQEHISTDLKEVKNIHPYMDDIIAGDESPRKHLKTGCALVLPQKLRIQTQTDEMPIHAQSCGLHRLDSHTRGCVHQQVQTLWC